MLLVWIKFLVCVAIVLISGAKLAAYGDAIAEKTGVGRAWIGLVLIAAVTSIPELVTGISAVTIVGSPDLAIGTVFGSNLFNLLIIALLDILYRPGPLVTKVSSGHLLSASVSIVLIAFAGASIFLSSNVSGLGIGWVGGYSFLLVLLYLVGTRTIFRFERGRQAVSPEAGALRYQNISLRRTYLDFAIAAVVIIGAGVWLATIGKEIAEHTGWSTGFVGSFFLAATTSLPEVVVSIAALRLGAIDMAVANMLGSNMFNMGIVIAADDLFYWHSPVLSTVSASHMFTALVAVLMTFIVIGGLIYRPRRKTPIGVSWYAIGLIIMYLVGAYIAFIMGAGLG